MEGGAPVDPREVLTVRVPTELASKARDVKGEHESMNDLVVAALEQEVRRRRAWAAHETILRVRAQVRARTGPQPDAAPLIHELRSGEGRRG